MEQPAKTRDSFGTYIAVKENGLVYLARLFDWTSGVFPKGTILRVALTKGAIKKWIRAYEFRAKAGQQ